MGEVNKLIIEVVEEVLKAQNKMEDDKAFNALMDLLINDTAKFWQEYQQIIPAKYHRLFKK